MNETPYNMGDTIRNADGVWTVDEIFPSIEGVGNYWLRFSSKKPFVPGFYRADFPGSNKDHIVKWHSYPGGPGKTWGGKPFEDAFVRVTVEDATDD